MSDCISRQAVLDALDEIEAEVADGYGYQYAKWREYFAEMPSAQPEPKRGRWIYKNDLITAPTGYWECSECKEGRLLYEENFCPHCGADMRGETDES